MDYKALLKDLRNNIDAIDAKLVELFQERLEICDKVADVKVQGNLPVTDLNRENEVIESAMYHTQDANKDDVSAFLQSIMTISKSRQNRKFE